MKRFSCFGVAVMISLLAPAARAAEPSPNEADAQKICAPFTDFKPGPVAQPTAEDRKRFGAKTEDCLDYVYGYAEARNRDLDKGRRCCLAQGSCNRELAMIFANGWGTPRDYDVATYFLCKAGDEIGAFEQWSMLDHLQAMRAAEKPKDLDYCDSVTSGRGASWCEGLELARRGPGWERRIEAVSKRLGAPARGALADLRKAADDFVGKDASLEAEESRGGTGYSSFIVAGQRERTEAFVTGLERFTRKRAPAAAAEALQSADRALNEIYQERLSKAGPCPTCDPHDTTSRNVLRDAQRSWIHYRDAWTAFYRLRWKGTAPPEALDREIATALTAQRTAELRKLNAEG